MDNFLATCIKQFQYYKSLGDKTFTQLSTEQLFWHPNDSSNSIALIVKHLGGNMLSRWTDFLSTDGEKENRNRDQEFENSWTDRDELITYWNAGGLVYFKQLNLSEKKISLKSSISVIKDILSWKRSCGNSHIILTTSGRFSISEKYVWMINGPPYRYQKVIRLPIIRRNSATKNSNNISPPSF